MILKSIILAPSYDEFIMDRNKDRYNIACQTTFLTHYLKRRLAALKFESKGFNRICVEGCSEVKIPIYLNSSNVLTASVKFDIDQCLTMKKDRLPDYYSKLLITGLKLCATKEEIPLEDLLTYIQDFQNNDYKNEWLFKEKTFKEFGIKCRLNCELTIDGFNLTLVISKKDKEIFNKIILKTDADEIAFDSKFKDIVVVDGKIGVTDKFGKVFFKTAIPADN